MGEVYRARDTRLDRSVAIKILHPHLSCSPELKSRFEREARTLSSLSHPHICSLYDVGKDGDVEFLVMLGSGKGAQPRGNRIVGSGLYVYAVRRIRVDQMDWSTRK